MVILTIAAYFSTLLRVFYHPLHDIVEKKSLFLLTESHNSSIIHFSIVFSCARAQCVSKTNRGGFFMRHPQENILAEQKAVYATPSVTVIRISTDVITESHADPNMGEWDTEI